jgi:hypothetical protein
MMPTMTLSGRRSLALLFATTSLLLACSALPGASLPGSTDKPTDAPTDSAGETPRPPDAGSPPGVGDCYGVQLTANMPPLSVALLMEASDAVVIGTVTKVGQAKWNTKDGRKPPNGINNAGAERPTVYTPIDVQVTESWHGNEKPGNLTVVNEGGEADCVTLAVTDGPVLDLEKQYLLFLGPSVNSLGEPNPEVPIVNAAWPVNGDGSVATAVEGNLTLDEVKRLVDDPGEPIESFPVPTATD